MRAVPHYRARPRRAAIGRRDGSDLVRKAEAGLPAKSQPLLPPSGERRRRPCARLCRGRVRRAFSRVYGHLDEPRHARHCPRLLIASPLAAGLLSRLRPPGGAAGRAAAARKVTVAEVVARDITEWDEVTGRLEAVNSVDIRPRVSGFVAAVAFEEGAIVRRGQLLFQIDPRPFQAQVDRLSAELSRARATVQRTASELKRAERLAGENAMSTEERERRASAADEATARRWPRSRRRCVPRSSISSSPGSPRRSTAGSAGPSSPRATSSRAARARRRCSPRSCRSIRSTPRSTPTSRPSCATATWPAPTAAPAAARPTCRCGWRSAASASSRMKGG